MRSQFDDVAKALAQGSSRRRVLGGIISGLVGVVAASLLPGSRSETVEAGAAPPADSSLRQASGANLPKPSVRLNQAPVRLNQGPGKLNRSAMQTNPIPARINQARQPAGFNQARVRARTTAQGAHTQSSSPALNQASFNQTRFNQFRQQWLTHGTPQFNTVHAQFNQSPVHLNQRGYPGWNQGH
jgi:hypothetical protein